PRPSPPSPARGAPAGAAADRPWRSVRAAPYVHVVEHPDAASTLLEAADAVERVDVEPMPLAPADRQHVRQVSQVSVDGRRRARELACDLALLQRRPWTARACARVTLARELSAALDDDGWGDVGEHQVAELVLPPFQPYGAGARVAFLRQLLDGVALDRFGERAAARLNAPKVLAFNHRSFDGLPP